MDQNSKKSDDNSSVQMDDNRSEVSFNLRNSSPNPNATDKDPGSGTAESSSSKNINSSKKDDEKENEKEAASSNVRKGRKRTLSLGNHNETSSQDHSRSTMSTSHIAKRKRGRPQKNGGRNYKFNDKIFDGVMKSMKSLKENTNKQFQKLEKQIVDLEEKATNLQTENEELKGKFESLETDHKKLKEDFQKLQTYIEDSLRKQPVLESPVNQIDSSDPVNFVLDVRLQVPELERTIEENNGNDSEPTNEQTRGQCTQCTQCGKIKDSHCNDCLRNRFMVTINELLPKN